jgi:hypothetical protein
MLMLLWLRQSECLTYTASVSHSSITLTFSEPLAATPQTQLFFFQDSALTLLPTSSTLSTNKLTLSFTNPKTFTADVVLLMNLPYLVTGTSSGVTSLFRTKIVLPGTELNLAVANIVTAGVSYLVVLASVVAYLLFDRSVALYLTLDFLQIVAFLQNSTFSLLKDSATLLYYLQPILCRFPYFDFYGLGLWWQEVQISLPLAGLGVVLLGLGTYTSCMHNNPLFRFLRFGLPLQVLGFLGPGLVQSSAKELFGPF